MTTMKLDLDPEIDGLLREIAADPKSKLLRVRRPVDVRVFAETRPAIGVATAGLTKAERHLVQAHREEVAHKLIQNALYWQTQGSSAPKLFSVQGVRLAGDEERPVNESVGMVEAPTVGSKSIPFDVALRQLLLSTPARPSPRELVAHCTLAGLLAPSPQVCIHLSAALVQAGEAEGACVALEGLLERPLNQWLNTVILTNVGLARFRTNNLAESEKAYSAAAQISPQYWMAVFSAINISARLGNCAEISRMAHVLRECIDTTDSSFRHALDQCRVPRRIVRENVNVRKELDRLACLSGRALHGD